jgi:hypothetical protein
MNAGAAKAVPAAAARLKNSRREVAMQFFLDRLANR